MRSRLGHLGHRQPQLDRSSDICCKQSELRSRATQAWIASIGQPNHAGLCTHRSSGLTLITLGASAWKPYRKGDVAIIGRIQRRATKLVPNLRSFDYTERLQHLRLTTLELRSTGGDLIEYHKYSNSLTQLNLSAPPLHLNAGSYDGPARNTREEEQRLTIHQEHSAWHVPQKPGNQRLKQANTRYYLNP